MACKDLRPRPALPNAPTFGQCPQACEGQAAHLVHFVSGNCDAAMSILDRIDALKNSGPDLGSFSHNLSRICALVTEGNRAEAEAALVALVQSMDRALLAQHFELVLQVAFFAASPSVATKLLTEKLLFAGRISVEFSAEIGRPFIVLLRKLGHNHIALVLSEKLPDFADLSAQIAWLLYIAPLLVKLAGSSKVGVGQAFLNQWDAGVVPGLTFCANRPDFFLLPDNVFLPTLGYRDLKQQLAQGLTPWEQRLPVAFWRGATTGQIPHGKDWRALQRVQLSEMSRRAPELLDAGISKIVQLSAQAAAELGHAGLGGGFFPATNLHMFKYLVDVDGNTNAWGGLFERLLTGSAILKIASPLDYEQWYYDRLRPWEHYVPVASDLSDLLGKIEWLRGHDAEARKIGENARALGYAIEYESEVDRALDTISAAFRAYSAAVHMARPRFGDRHPLVFTCHRSVVCFSRKLGRILHVPPEDVITDTSYLPLSLERRLEGAVFRAPGGEYVTNIGPDGTASLMQSPPGGREAYFKLTDGHLATRPGSYAMSLGGNFACADNDMALTFSRGVISTWESFDRGSLAKLLEK